MSRLFMYHFIKTVEFQNKNIENFYLTQQIPTPQYQKKIHVNIGSLKGGFPLYSLLKIKENSQNVHLEL